MQEMAGELGVNHVVAEVQRGELGWAAGPASRFESDQSLGCSLYKPEAPVLASSSTRERTQSAHAPNPFERNRLDEDESGSHTLMSDYQELTNIEYLRRELIDRMDAEAFEDWSPALLRTLIAVFDLNGFTPVVGPTFRPYLVK
jgi:hypothetical protein